jgi:hypothetical protein
MNGKPHPPGFSMKELQMDNRSMMSKNQRGTSAKNVGKTISIYREFDEKAFEGWKIPITREDGGKWLMDADFRAMFHYI